MIAKIYRPLNAQNRTRSGSWGGVNESDEDLSLAVAFANSSHNNNNNNHHGVFIHEEQQHQQQQQQFGLSHPSRIEEEFFRRKLAFFFLNPWDKYQARRQIPWKLMMQFLKAIFVTWLLLLFGSYRSVC